MMRIILLVVVIFIAKMASAQQIEKGVRFGYNMSDWHGNVWQSVSDITSQSSEVASLQNRYGFNIGIYTMMPLNHFLNVESGLYYDQKGVGVRVRPFESILSPQLKSTVKLDYLTVPVNINIKTWGGLQIAGGASVSKLINSSLGIKGSWLGIGVGESFPIKRAFNNWDFNLQGGALYQFDNGFQLKAEYRHGLSRLNRGIIDADVFNKGVTVGIGFRF